MPSTVQPPTEGEEGASTGAVAGVSHAQQILTIAKKKGKHTFGECVVIPKFAGSLRFFCALLHDDARWRLAHVGRQADGFISVNNVFHLFLTFVFSHHV